MDHSTLKVPVLRKYKRNRIFIETGTHTGGGVQVALDCGFEKAYSIEITPRLYRLAVERTYLPLDREVTIILGDSAEVLPELLRTINEPCTFWLDAHQPWDGVAHGAPWSQCPVLLELDAIMAHTIRTHTIFIDDMQDFESGIHDGISVPQLTERLVHINPSFRFSFEEGSRPASILVASLP